MLKYMFPLFKKIKMNRLLLMILFLSLSWSLVAKPYVMEFYQEDLTENKKKQLCEMFPDDCINENIWAFKKVADDQYYFISQEKVYLIKEENYKLVIEDHWDFLNFEPKKTKSIWFGGGKVMGVSVQSALYPIDGKNLAVAVRYGWSDNDRQFNGLITESSVDFVKLEKNGQYQVLLENVPFYYYSMTWYCLNGELDLDPNAKCIENEEFNLSVTYIKPKKWQMIMKYQRDASPFSKHHEFHVQKPVNVNLDFPREITVPNEWLKY